MKTYHGPLRPRAPDIIVTPEAEALPLACEVAARLERPSVVLRKSCKTYMGDALRERPNSITTGDQQTMFLGEKDPTGSTLAAMRTLLQRAGATIVAESAVFTEGERGRWAPS